jgi:hypothetical protein
MDAAGDLAQVLGALAVVGRVQLAGQIQDVWLVGPDLGVPLLPLRGDPLVAAGGLLGGRRAFSSGSVIGCSGAVAGLPAASTVGPWRPIARVTG